MPELKATPGPWLIEKERDGDISIWARKPLPNAIATVLYEDVNGGNPVETNANLIAAAPCMAKFIQKHAEAGDAEAIELWERINANS